MGLADFTARRAVNYDARGRPDQSASPDRVTRVVADDDLRLPRSTRRTNVVSLAIYASNNKLSLRANTREQTH